ncbi:TMV resistance protein N isoform X3 [Glycine max]|uniref:TMV resistance protein N isoform X3 n=1 Tax=Glycine max TaxID=3847 RepID=UPI001B356584|nr:TMV resistance protein N isoform X3 [Glycine max]
METENSHKPLFKILMAVRSFSYDVFLSFRGEDTRYCFTGNLYNVLRERGIHTFIDDDELQKGDQITSALQEAIEKSKIFIIVLSENYASSSFCLNELTHILNFTKGKNDLLVLPVFYIVDPSDVRHHRGSFGEALANHEKKLNSTNMENLETWKIALHQVSNISGYHFQHDGDKYEYKFIKEIVELVSNKFNRDLLHVSDALVGLESPVLEVKSLMDVGSDDVVQMVGIHGLGGVGKTTLAVAVYNSIADHFEASCFLENVRETSNKKGLQHLQSILLSKTVGEKKIKLTNWREGIHIIKRKLKEKKVLLILDDVDEQKQLQAIIGSPDWFGGGSRVIITTRDEHLLALHNVKITYKVRELNEKHALQLLSQKAFELEKEVDPSYHDILNRAVAYASGLPLALEVIGSNLFEKSIEEWESALNGYERIPDKSIYMILKVSYDALNEDEKSIFLDIACCFKDYELGELQDILYAHYGRCMKYHIGVLVKKSLINIHWWGKLMRLHDLIEDMGKEIVRRESPTEPGKRSRLWSHEDINQVLHENKRLVNLTSLILDECDSLTEIPDVSCLSKLEKLSFARCRNLFTIHHSVGLLEKLKILDAEGCRELKSFPPLKLTSLERFELSYCVSLESFPEILGKMENITELGLIDCPITKLPPSFRNLTRLQVLYLGQETYRLRGFDAATFISNICMMPELFRVEAAQLQWRLPDDVLKLTSVACSSIQFLCFANCDLGDELLPLIFSCFVNVINLDLSWSKFTVIPECIKECRFLTILTLDFCNHLQEFRGIPPNLKKFSAIGCPALTSSSISMLLNQELHEAGDTNFSLPRVEIPEWFECQSRGPSIFFWFRNEFPAIAVCVVNSDFKKFSSYLVPSVIINGHEYKHKPLCSYFFDGKPCTVVFRLQMKDNLHETLLEKEWNRAEIVCEDSCDEYGIHVWKQQSSMGDIRFTDPFRKRNICSSEVAVGEKTKISRQ